MFRIKSRIKQYIDASISESLKKTAPKPDSGVVDILNQRYGYALTQQKKVPLAADGSPIPWYTYPAIEYFNQLDVTGLRIFEFGSGHSSLYWARKGAEVWSVEHDPTWHQTMTDRSSQLQQLLLRESADTYSQAIADVGGIFDIVIIDGAWRNQCAATALQHISPNGMIILDNSDWYTDVLDEFKRKGFFSVDFNGFGPINNYCWTTSILLPLQGRLGLSSRHPTPIGGIEASKGDKW